MARIFVYIDNIVIARSDDKEVTRLIDLLSKEFPIRDLGDLKFFLGIQVNHTSQGIHLSQTQHLVNLLRNCESCDMENLKPAVTSMIASVDLQ